MKNRFRAVVSFGIVCFFNSAICQATLIDMGGGLIYDEALNVTWLQDASYSFTTEGILGRSWDDASQWVEQLEYYDPVRDRIVVGWRLPTTINDPSSVGWDTTGMSSELAYMYYVNLGYQPNFSGDRWSPDPTSDNYNPFINLAYRSYWSGTSTDNPDRPDQVWALHMHFGNQDFTGGSGDTLRIWALVDGNAASVPEPSTLVLLCMGLIGIGFSRRKKNSNLNQCISRFN